MRVLPTAKLIMSPTLSPAGEAVRIDDHVNLRGVPCNGFANVGGFACSSAATVLVCLADAAINKNLLGIGS